MKKIFITILVILVLILAAVWAYLLLNGAPQGAGDLLNGFNPPAADVVEVPEISEPPEEDTVVAIDARAVLLSERPVAGAVLLEKVDEVVARYAEKGTGRIYDVSLADGMRTNVSNTVVPRTTEVVWAPSGTRAAFVSELAGGAPEIFVGTITRRDDGSEVLETSPLPANSENVAFLDAGDALYYTVRDDDGSRGYRFDLKTDTTAELFFTPLRYITMIWDTSGEGEHYLYTNPSGTTIGYLFSVSGNTLVRVEEAPGLIARRADDSKLVVSSLMGRGMHTRFHTIGSNESVASDVSLFPEKCAATEGAELLCAGMANLPPNTYPDAWYQGIVSSRDILWRILPTSGRAELVLNLENATGAPFDVSSLMHSSEENSVVAIDKNTDRLWLINL